jgi:hypothetical protein
MKKRTLDPRRKSGITLSEEQSALIPRGQVGLTRRLISEALERREGIKGNLRERRRVGRLQI